MRPKETIDTATAQYICTLKPDPAGGYSVRCAAFPELISHGDTLEEARIAAREALELCVEVYREEGRELPPSDAEPRTTIREIIPVRLRA